MVAINGWLPAGPLLHCLTSTTAKVIVIDPERAERLTPHLSELKAAPTILLAAAGGREPRPRPGMVSFDAAIDQYRGPEEAWRSEPECSLDDNATIFFTSGTTGLPKGVLSSQRGFMQGYLANNFSRDRYKVTMGLPPVPYPVPSDQVGCMAIASPLMHVAGCTSAMMSATNNGGKVVLMRKVSSVYHSGVEANLHACVVGQRGRGKALSCGEGHQVRSSYSDCELRETS